MNRKGYVYIMTNQYNTVLYTGVTSDLKKRIYQHKQQIIEGFTKKYKINKLVYYEVAENIEAVIMKEKQIKAGNRKKKIQLITNINPEWRDLYEEI